MAKYGNEKRANNFKNRVGEKYGRLTVISEASKMGHLTQWNCLCSCGNSTIVLSCNLVAGLTKSCGCLRREASVKRQTTHDMSHGREHNSWSMAKNRCFNQKSPDYKNYGGRGITMCKEWRDNFEAFYARIGPCPEGHSLDRYPNNDGNYEPGNVRWATRLQQNRNQRRPRKSRRMIQTV